jgi:hypothetical protein
MQIVRCLYGEFSTDLFEEINMLIALVRTFQLVVQEIGLHLVVVFV